MRPSRSLASSLLALGLAATAAAGEVVTYEHDGLTLKGYLATPAGSDGLAPGVLVVPEWWGLNDYARSRADMLAEAGFVAFAPDMVGDGKTTTDPKQAGAWAGAMYGDPALWRARAAAGLAVLAGRDGVDADRLGAIGFCFGGSTALQLAYAGADLDAVVSFHGGLEKAGEGEADDVRAELLVFHGGADPLVPFDKTLTFKLPLQKAGVPFTFVEFAGAKHAFSNPSADSYGLPPVGYDARAAGQSWSMCVAMLQRVLKN